MEEGSSPLGLTSSPPPIRPTDHESLLLSAMDIEPSSPVLPTIHLPEPPTSTEQRNESFLFSTDPLQGPENSQSTGHISALFPRKRSAGQYLAEPQKPNRPVYGGQTKDLILQARSLIIKASTTASTHTEQTSLLDLLEVFRDYTENGRVKTSASILATQVASLEYSTRTIGTKANQLAKLANTAQSNASTTQLAKTTLSTTQSKANTTSNQTGPTLGNQTFASIAKQYQTPSQNSESDWQTVSNKKPSIPKRPRQVDNRLVLIKSLLYDRASEMGTFSPIQLRNAFNKAFADKGIQGPVVATVSRSLQRNIVVTTTPSFSASFLLEKKAIWEHVVPYKSAQIDTPWFKVIIHGIPIIEFDTTTGMQLVVNEIKTFNKGYSPIETLYWLITASKR